MRHIRILVKSCLASPQVEEIEETFWNLRLELKWSRDFKRPSDIFFLESISSTLLWNTSICTTSLSDKRIFKVSRLQNYDKMQQVTSPLKCPYICFLFVCFKMNGFTFNNRILFSAGSFHTDTRDKSTHFLPKSLVIPVRVTVLACWDRNWNNITLS